MEKGKVFFVGAGPGNPELITLKGSRIIEKADVIIYAGSLINIEVLDCAKTEAKKYDSAYLNYEEVMEITKTAVTENKIVARVHTGDTGLFSTIREQIIELKKENIEYEIIPGVSSFSAAAASLAVQYTLPDVSQSLIITRRKGRTLVPEKEDLPLLAKHNASMVIFLSIQMVKEVVEDLMTEYKPETPAVVVYKASWKEEKIIRGNLLNIAEKVKENKITKTALILVGEFLNDNFSMSKLYNKEFSHEFRKGAE